MPEAMLSPAANVGETP
jgi:hypothetical protein